MGERRVADRYEPVATLGRGGQATVLKAIDTRHDRFVALKVRDAPDGATDDLLREARALLSLPAHPGLAHARDDLFDAGRHVLVIDWVDGVDLAQLLAAHGRPGLPVSTVVRWAAQAAEALGVLHHHGVVHGDLKPANLVVDRGGHVVLVDLGSSSSPGSTGPRGGTPGFRAPEVAAGSPPTPASDVYGLAATVYALLTGGPPTGGAPVWRGLDPATAARVESAVRSGLAVDPARRPPTPGALVERLRTGTGDVTASGVVTVLASDALGAGELWEHAPQDAPAVLAALELALDASVESHGGRRAGGSAGGVRTTSVFVSPVDAVRAAVDLQRSLRRGAAGLPVRVGVATGVPVLADGEVVGPTVNRAAEVRDLARAGEVLLSETTADVVRLGLPAGVDLLPLGPLRLPGIGMVDAVAGVVADGVSAPPDPGRCPYPGLEPYAAGDADLFVGREPMVERCRSLLAARGFVAVVGASGSGKTSLVLAGLAPALGDVVVVRPGARPLEALERAGAGERPASVLVVDQLEELVTLCPDAAERADFAAAVLSHPGGAVVTVRADLYGELATLPDLAERLSDSQVLLGALDGADVVRAVVEPAQRCGLVVEPGLAEVVAAELGRAPGALPLLGHALRETWLRRDGRTVTLAAYRASGGVESAVAATADHALATLDDEHRRVARQVLLRLVELRRDGDDVRRWAPREELLGIEPLRTPVVLEALAGARLLVVDDGQVSVAHEALLRAWPTLGRWIDEERADLLVRQELRVDAARWAAGGRIDADLYRGARLESALEVAARAGAGEQERSFVDAGRAMRDRERAEARQRSRRLRTLAVAATAFAVVALAVGAVAVAQRNDARRARVDAERAAAAADEAARLTDEQRQLADAAARDARIEALVGRAASIRETQRDTAALLAAEAFRLADTPTTRAALFATFTEADGFLDTRRLDGVSGIEGGAGIVLPNGRRGYVTGADGRLRPYAPDTGDVGAPLDAVGPGDDPYSFLAASPDGDLLAQITWSGSGSSLVSTVGVFDTETNRLRFPPVTVEGYLNTAAFVGADRRLAASVSDDGSVVVFDSTDGRQIASAPGPGSGYDPSGGNGIALAVSGGDVLVATAVPRQLRVLGSTDLAVRRVVELPGGLMSTVADAGDGSVVVASDASVARVDASDGEVLWAATAPESCLGIAVDPDRQRLYCGSAFGRLEERSLTTGEVLRRLDGQQGNTGSLWVTGADELVAFGVNEPVVSRWRLDGSGPVTTRLAPGFDPVGLSPDGSQVIVNRGSPVDGTYENRLLDATSGQFVRSLAPLFAESFTGDASVGGVILDEDTGAVELATIDLATGLLERSGVRLDPAPVGAESATGKQRVLLIYERADGEPGAELRILDPSTDELGRPVVVGGSNSLSASSDGSLVAVGTADGKGIEIYDATTGELVDRIEGATQAGYITVTDQLFVSSLGGALTQHDLQTLEEIRTFGGASGFIQEVQGTLDGRLMMARGGDRTVSVYDVASGVRLGTPITIADEATNHAVLAPDGSKLAVSGAEGVLVWDLDPARWLAAACEVAGRNLTRTEWETNIGTLAPYEPTCPGLPAER